LFEIITPILLIIGTIVAILIALFRIIGWETTHPVALWIIAIALSSGVYFAVVVGWLEFAVYFSNGFHYITES